MNPTTSNPNHPKTASLIARAIREADRRTRGRFPVLRHQTAIGMGFVLVGYGIAGLASWLYLAGSLPAWACIIANAVAAAVLREIEHDLIHNLYFIGKRSVQNVVLFLIWPALGNVPGPLYRRKIHLQHHRSSGTETDLEERLLGNGTGYGFMRWLTMLDSGISTIFRKRELEQIPGYRRSELILHLLPVVAIFYVAWVSFLVYHLATFCAGLAGAAPQLPAGMDVLVRLLDATAVIWVLPNVLRQAALQVLSSSMHYYGDIHGVEEQTQVLTKWYWQPLQFLSCNFGKSHAIHHFVANQPFYLRELVRREAHGVMRKHGVRFDDLGTFQRANRWGARPEATPQAPSASAASISGILFLELQGKLDPAAAVELEQNLMQSIEGGVRRLSLDFSKLEKISNAGLRVLLRSATRVSQAEGKLAFHSMPEPLKQIFLQTGFSLLFPIHPSREEATRWLSTNHSVTVC